MFGMVRRENPGEREKTRMFFNSRGKYIAAEIEGRLYSAAGRHVGRRVDKYGIFVDLAGRYLGEILCANRLARNRGSRFLQTSFGACKHAEARPAVARPRDYSPVILPPGYEDVDVS
ncbi:MAG: hypothetical protein ACM3X6_09970 [Patescibacteria group bacterium]